MRNFNKGSTTIKYDGDYYVLNMLAQGDKITY